MARFTQAECLQIDPEGKNVLFIHYPPNMSSRQLDDLSDSFSSIKEDLDRWIKEPDSSVYIIAIPDDIKVRLEKVANKNRGVFYRLKDFLVEKFMSSGGPISVPKQPFLSDDAFDHSKELSN